MLFLRRSGSVEELRNLFISFLIHFAYILNINRESQTVNHRPYEIHWHYHCTVHDYVVIHFHNRMWSFWVEQICAGLLLLVYICIAVDDQIIKTGTGIILSRHMTLISNDKCNILLCVFNDLWFCWYWWNCSSSLFKLSYHDKWNNSFLSIWGLSWSWSYCRWIYNYLCNQCLSPLKLCVRIQLMARCTRCNFM